MMNEYVNRLINLVQKKVQNVAAEVQDDPELFSHLIDECVAFENEIQGKILFLYDAQISVLFEYNPRKRTSS